MAIEEVAGILDSAIGGQSTLTDGIGSQAFLSSATLADQRSFEEKLAREGASSAAPNLTLQNQAFNAGFQAPQEAQTGTKTEVSGVQAAAQSQAPNKNAAQEPQMPGIGTALLHGVWHGGRDLAQTGTALAGGRPTADAQRSPAAAPLQWSDLLSPASKLAPKLAYQLGESWPTVAGGAAGTAIGVAAAGGPEDPLALVTGPAGGALGAGLTSGLQSFGKYFGEELGRTPGDADGAYSRALERATVSGVFSGGAWAAFPARAFQGPLKNMMFQAFGVQPGVNMAHQAADNTLTGKPLTEGLGNAYTQGAIGTLPIAGGHYLGGKLGQQLPGLVKDKLPLGDSASDESTKTGPSGNANAGETQSTERESAAARADRTRRAEEAIREARDRFGATPVYQGSASGIDGRATGAGVGSLGGIAATVYRARPEVAEIWNRGGISAPEFAELKPGNGVAFHDAIGAAKSSSTQGAAVALYSSAEYDHMRLFLTPDGKAGFALKGDDIVSVFRHPESNVRNFVTPMLDLAVSQGGRRLDAFDTALPILYSRGGFRAVSRTAFNPDFAPEGWDYKTFSGYNDGKPDIVFMIYDPAYGKLYKAGDGVSAPDYDTAASIQNREARPSSK